MGKKTLAIAFAALLVFLFGQALAYPALLQQNAKTVFFEDFANLTLPEATAAGIYAADFNAENINWLQPTENDFFAITGTTEYSISWTDENNYILNWQSGGITNTIATINAMAIPNDATYKSSQSNCEAWFAPQESYNRTNNQTNQNNYGYAFCTNMGTGAWHCLQNMSFPDNFCIWPIVNMQNSCSFKQQRNTQCGTTCTYAQCSSYNASGSMQTVCPSISSTTKYNSSFYYFFACGPVQCYVSTTNNNDQFIETCTNNCSYGQCISNTSCSNECSQGQSRCNGSYQQTCGNYDTDCLEWPTSISGSGNTLCPSGCNSSTNACNSCDSHARSECYNNDLYWFDSCGNRQEIKQDCVSNCSNSTCDPTGNSTTTNINVPANIKWFSSGLNITSGKMLSITATGNWSGNGSNYNSPDGYTSLAPSGFVAPDLRVAALVAKIASNAPFFVGSNYSGTANATGTLYFAFNDDGSGFADNTGSLSTTITIGDACANECNAGETGCVGTQKWQCGEANDNDNCLEKVYSNCSNGCNNGTCINCTSHASQACQNNDVFWKDSCGQIQEIKQDCGDSSCSFGEYYCQGNNTVRDKTCNNKGCSNNACFSNPTTTLETIACQYGCNNGTCIGSIGVKATDKWNNPINNASVFANSTLKGNTDASGTLYFQTLPGDSGKTYSINVKTATGTDCGTKTTIINFETDKDETLFSCNNTNNTLYATISTNKTAFIVGETIEFNITVRDQSGNAIGNASIGILDPQDNTIATKQTDSSGQAAYSALAKKAGFFRFEFSIAKGGFDSIKKIPTIQIEYSVLSDSDGDGISDKDEQLIGSEPLNAQSNLGSLLLFSSMASWNNQLSWILVGLDSTQREQAFESLKKLDSAQLESLAEPAKQQQAAQALESVFAGALPEKRQASLQSLFESADETKQFSKGAIVVFVLYDKETKTTSIATIGANCTGFLIGLLYGAGNGLNDDATGIGGIIDVAAGVLNGIWFYTTHASKIVPVLSSVWEFMISLPEMIWNSGGVISQEFRDIIIGILKLAATINPIKNPSTEAEKLDYAAFQTGFLQGYVAGYIAEQVVLIGFAISKIGEAVKGINIATKTYKTIDQVTATLARISKDTRFGPETANAIEQIKHLNWIDNILRTGTEAQKNGLARITKALKNNPNEVEKFFGGMTQQTAKEIAERWEITALRLEKIPCRGGCGNLSEVFEQLTTKDERLGKLFLKWENNTQNGLMKIVDSQGIDLVDDGFGKYGEKTLKKASSFVEKYGDDALSPFEKEGKGGFAITERYSDMVETFNQKKFTNWVDDSVLDNHWVKHKAEFVELGINSKEQYTLLGKDIATAAQSEKRVAESTKYALYDSSRNIIAFANKDGEIISIFRPTEGIEYARNLSMGVRFV